VSAPISRALVSVSDKTGLLDLGRFLVSHGVEILSTGGSAKVLVGAGIPVTEVAKYTGFPEILGGRVKTLHPKVHGGILAIRGKSADESEIAGHGISAIDLVVVNLYPFEKTVASGAALADCIEQIDIGGPSMIRAAAKNYAGVTVVVDPVDYVVLTDAMAANDGTVPLELRRVLATNAFSHTAAYDAAISRWFVEKGTGEPLPERMVLSGTRALTLRYGENPHLQAALYVTGEARPGAATAHQVQGKALSYNNLVDADAAFELAAEFSDPAVAIIKHANPSGVAVDQSISRAHERALACDRTSAFGGVVAANRPLDGTAAEVILQVFTEVVIAPNADEEALRVLAKKSSLRVLLTGGVPDAGAAGLTARTIAGGLLVQSRDAGQVVDTDVKVVTRRSPTTDEIRDLLFAWRVCKHVKSNAIVFAKDNATTGVGAGQMSRIDSVRVATIKAEAKEASAGASAVRGSVLASDAFFPFADGLTAAAEAGATAVIQPGGSVRDNEVIAAADEAGIAMVFTGMRHFRH